jgi:DNA-binding NtrC family response regulator
MAKSTKPLIFILEDDAYFRNLLENVCGELGAVLAAADIRTAAELLTANSFQVLLLDWHLNLSDPSLQSAIENFQSGADRLALFTVPDLHHVIGAMKAGASDILWATLEREKLKEKLMDVLGQGRRSRSSYSLSRLAESITEKAMVQKSSLFQARREFSRIFLQQLLSQQKMRRAQLADLISVSPRTLHRHLSA